MLSSAQIKTIARSVGFHGCGIARATQLEGFEARFRTWLSLGRQGDMQFMEKHVEMRSDPRLLVEGAQSVICLLLGYKPSQTMQGPHRVAQYAYGEDYHERIRQMLFRLIALIRESRPTFEAKPCVDTVPISDKLWAAQAGLGWIGKHTLLVSPVYGSYCHVAELVTTESFDHYDSPIANRCNGCTLCLKACPNHALDEKGLDCRRCISYNTIENRAPQLPDDLTLNGYSFGCDCCQMVCPYNKDVPPTVEISDQRIRELETLSATDPTEFRRRTRHSAINRIKHAQWQRNLQHPRP